MGYLQPSAGDWLTPWASPALAPGKCRRFACPACPSRAAGVTRGLLPADPGARRVLGPWRCRLGSLLVPGALPALGRSGQGEVIGEHRQPKQVAAQHVEGGEGEDPATARVIGWLTLRRLAVQLPVGAEQQRHAVRPGTMAYGEAQGASGTCQLSEVVAQVWLKPAVSAGCPWAHMVSRGAPALPFCRCSDRSPAIQDLAGRPPRCHAPPARGRWPRAARLGGVPCRRCWHRPMSLSSMRGMEASEPSSMPAGQGPHPACR